MAVILKRARENATEQFADAILRRNEDELRHRLSSGGYATSESDARAEAAGVGGDGTGFLPPDGRAYRDLWKAINGPGSWNANPWMWVLEARRVLHGEEQRA